MTDSENFQDHNTLALDAAVTLRAVITSAIEANLGSIMCPNGPRDVRG